MNMLKGICAVAFLLSLIACGGGSSSKASSTPTPTPTPTGTTFPNDQHLAQTAPVKMGTTGGNATDTNGSFCCSGTLGSLVQDTGSGTFFILSNNHVLAKSSQGVAGQPISQPGLVDSNCGNPVPPPTVATLTQMATLKPSPCSGVCTGPAPSNVDAAIAQIVTTPTAMVDTSGSILDLGAAGATSIAAAQPSNTLAIPATVLGSSEGVAKSGRSSGLTCSTLQSISTDVQVDYDAACNGAKAFTATFSNQVIVNGGNFSAAGDSGSLVVTSDTARPVGLLYAGNSTTSSANPIADVLSATAFPGKTLAIVGGGDHAVSCARQASAPSASPSRGGTGAISASERQRVDAVQQRRGAGLLQDPAITAVEIGASEDSPGEGALVIKLSGTPRSLVPATIDGVRTKVVVSGQAGAPRLSSQDMDQAIAVKETHAADLMSQSGIQGVGVGRSADNPAETAIVIYVLSGQAHPPIPAVLDGVRTQIVEGDRFRAFGWGKETKPATKCKKK
jgi:hypothetical protein